MHGGHYLRPTKGDTLPSQACVVAWIETKGKRNGHDNVYEPGFLTGSLVRWRQRGRDQLCRFQFPARSAAEVLESLRKQALGGSLTWCFTFGLKSLLACAGFWDKVLAGEIDLWGEDRGIPRDPTKNGKRKWSGYVVLENPPAIVVCRWRPHGGAVKFVDLANYNLDGWKQLSGIDQEGLTEIPPNEHGPRTLVALTEFWARSGEQWLLDLWRLMLRENLGAWQTTGAGQAQYTFRRRFLSHDILAHESDEVKKLERRALYGGRCELNFQGTVKSDTRQLFGDPDIAWSERQAIVAGPIYHLDVQSMYPAVTLGQAIPARLDRHFPNGIKSNIWMVSGGQVPIADVTVNMRAPAVPLTVDGNTIWPTGKFRTTLCGPELGLAQDHGEILHCHELVTYHSEKLFDDYIRFFWDLRQDARAPGQESIAAWAKQMLVAVFGKFSQRSKRWIGCPSKKADEPFDQWFQAEEGAKKPVSYRSMAWAVERLTVIGEHRQSCPAITAWVNSLGKCYLWKLIQTAGLDQCFYWNTDSLFTTGLGLDRLTKAGFVGPGELGKLKIKAQHKEVIFRGINHYVADGWRLCAGLPPMFEKDLFGLAETESDLSVSWDLLKQQAPSGCSLRGLVTTGLDYQHGKVLPNGKIVPHEMKG